jgi:hypothetical protein
LGAAEEEMAMVTRCTLAVGAVPCPLNWTAG